MCRCVWLLFCEENEYDDDYMLSNCHRRMILHRENNMNGHPPCSQVCQSVSLCVPPDLAHSDVSLLNAAAENSSVCVNTEWRGDRAANCCVCSNADAAATNVRRQGAVASLEIFPGELKEFPRWKRNPSPIRTRRHSAK